MGVSDGHPLSGFTDAQLLCVAILPKLTASISLAISIYVAAGIIRDSEKRARVYHRIILTLALHSIPFSIANLIGTLAAPQGSEKTAWAIGTIETCTTQGFFIMYGCSVPFYYSSLSMYSVVAVYNKFNQKVLRKYEPLLYIGVTICAVTSAIICVKEKMLNPSGPWCFIEVYPMGCETSDTIDCIRGVGDDSNAVNSFKSKVFIFPGLISFGLSVISMIALYLMVWNAERLIIKTEGMSSYLSEARLKKSGTVARQASLYIFFGYSPAFGSFILRTIQVHSGVITFPTAILAWSLAPLQPFTGLMVYIWLLRAVSVKPISNVSSNDTPSVGGSVAHSMSVASITERARNKKKKNECNDAQIPEFIPFSIFDGSSPSSRWAEFITSDSE